MRYAVRTIETLKNRQQKMASAELGDRDAFGVKLDPAGAVVHVFQVRGGKVVEHVELLNGAVDRAGEGHRTDFPVAMNPGLARAIGTMLIQDFQRTVLNRNPRMSAQSRTPERPVLFLCDDH